MNKEKGFTLVETMLYLSIMAVVLAGVSSFVYTMIVAQGRQANADVHFADEDRVQRTILSDIRNAKAIILPIQHAQGDELVLSIGTTGVTYELVSSALWRRVAAHESIRITSTDTMVRDFVVEHLATTSSAGFVRVRFTTTLSQSFRGNTAVKEYTVYMGASLRQSP